MCCLSRMEVVFVVAEGEGRREQQSNRSFLKKFEKKCIFIQHNQR